MYFGRSSYSSNKVAKPRSSSSWRPRYSADFACEEGGPASPLTCGKLWGPPRKGDISMTTVVADRMRAARHACRMPGNQHALPNFGHASAARMHSRCTKRQSVKGRKLAPEAGQPKLLHVILTFRVIIVECVALSRAIRIDVYGELVLSPLDFPAFPLLMDTHTRDCGV